MKYQEQISPNKLNERIEEIFSSIQTHEEYKEFKALQEKFIAHEKIQRYINELQHNQKQLVNAQVIRKKELIRFHEDEEVRIQTQLEQIPLYLQYKEKEETINNILQAFEERLYALITPSTV